MPANGIDKNVADHPNGASAPVRAGAAPVRSTNPLHSSDSKLKLGIFSTNVEHGGAMTTAEGTFEATWDNVVATAEIADRAGMEAIVPVARWRGFGGQTNFGGTCFEPLAWAAGLGSVVKNASVFSTCHMPMIHPIIAAKQGTTIDHITGGRFTMNIVANWYEPESQMFGIPHLAHESRYDFAEEWVEVLKLLWAGEDDFDFDGTYFQIKKGFSSPRPIQQPFPPIMQAGGSPRGRQYAAKHADIAFTSVLADLSGAREMVEEFKSLAHDEHDREIKVWTTSYVVIGDTDAEAEKFLHHYVDELGDWQAVDNMTEQMGMHQGIFSPEVLELVKYHFVAGWGGYPLVGTAETIVDRLGALSDVGIDGTLLTFVRYQPELQRFVDQVMPALVAKGLRV